MRRHSAVCDNGSFSEQGDMTLAAGSDGAADTPAAPELRIGSLRAEGSAQGEAVGSNEAFERNVALGPS